MYRLYTVECSSLNILIAKKYFDNNQHIRFTLQIKLVHRNPYCINKTIDKFHNEMQKKKLIEKPIAKQNRIQIVFQCVCLPLRMVLLLIVGSDLIVSFKIYCNISIFFLFHFPRYFCFISLQMKHV